MSQAERRRNQLVGMVATVQLVATMVTTPGMAEQLERRREAISKALRAARDPKGPAVVDRA